MVVENCVQYVSASQEQKTLDLERSEKNRTAYKSYFSFSWIFHGIFITIVLTMLYRSETRTSFAAKEIQCLKIEISTLKDSISQLQSMRKTYEDSSNIQMPKQLLSRHRREMEDSPKDVTIVANFKELVNEKVNELRVEMKLAVSKRFRRLQRKYHPKVLSRQRRENEEELEGVPSITNTSDLIKEKVDELRVERKLAVKKRFRRLRRRYNLKLDSTQEAYRQATNFSTIAAHFVITDERNWGETRAASSIGPWKSRDVPSASLVPVTRNYTTLSPQNKLVVNEHHVILVKTAGFYYVYGQVLFQNQSPLNIMAIKAWPQSDEDRPETALVQCVQEQLFNKNDKTFLSCSSSVVQWFEADTFVELESRYSGREINPINLSTFMGLFRVL